MYSQNILKMHVKETYFGHANTRKESTKEITCNSVI